MWGPNQLGELVEGRSWDAKAMGVIERTWLPTSSVADEDCEGDGGTEATAATAATATMH